MTLNSQLVEAECADSECGPPIWWSPNLCNQQVPLEARQSVNFNYYLEINFYLLFINDFDSTCSLQYIVQYLHTVSSMTTRHNRIDWIVHHPPCGWPDCHPLLSPSQTRDITGRPAEPGVARVTDQCSETWAVNGHLWTVSLSTPGSELERVSLLVWEDASLNTWCSCTFILHLLPGCTTRCHNSRGTTWYHWEAFEMWQRILHYSRKCKHDSIIERVTCSSHWLVV